MSIGVGEAGLPFPVKSKTLITPNNISIVIHAYSNRLFIILSDPGVGGTGTLVEFRKCVTEAETPSLFGAGDEQDEEVQGGVVYDIKVLFGVEKEEFLLAARVLGSEITKSGCTDLPLLFGLGIKKFDKPLLEGLAPILISEIKKL